MEAMRAAEADCRELLRFFGLEESSRAPRHTRGKSTRQTRALARRALTRAECGMTRWCIGRCAMDVTYRGVPMKLAIACLVDGWDA